MAGEYKRNVAPLAWLTTIIVIFLVLAGKAHAAPDVKKRCNPPTWNASTLAWDSKCQIVVTAPGYANGTLYLREQFSASGGPGYISALNASGWTCNPPSIPPALASAANVVCQRPAAGFTSTVVDVDLQLSPAVKHVKNCAKLYYNSMANLVANGCGYFDVPAAPATTPVEFKVDKTCALYVQFRPDLGIYKCTITVSASGQPLPSVITLADTLQSTGTNANTLVSLLGVTSADPWTCQPGPATPGSPLACSIPGAGFPANGTSVLESYVSYNSAAVPGTTENCIQLTAPGLAALPEHRSCTPIGPPAPTTATINIEKVATYNGQFLPQQSFPVSATCGNSVSNFDLLNGGSPYSLNNIPAGTSCNIMEGNAVPPQNVCPPNTTPSWNTSYSLAQPFIPPPGVTTVTIKNDLACTPIVQSNFALTVQKTCSPFSIPFIYVGMAFSGPNGVPPPWWMQDWATQAVYICQIKVTATGGPVPPVITLTDQLSSGLPNAAQLISHGVGHSTDPWICSPAFTQQTGHPVNAPVTCTIAGSSFPASGVSTLLGAAIIQASENAPPAQNCASAAANSQPAVASAVSCVDLPVPPLPPGGKINLKKIGKINGQVTTNNAQHWSLGNFHIIVDCGAPAIAGFMINANDTVAMKNIPVNATCTVSEATPPTTGLCPPGQIGSWTTTYSPAATFTVPNGTINVAVTNDLTCVPGPPQTGTVSVHKYLIDRNGSPLDPVANQIPPFDVTLTCGADIRQLSIAGGTTVDTSGILTSSTCDVLESPPPPPPAHLCPSGFTASWQTHYLNFGPVHPSASPINQAGQWPLLWIKNRVMCQLTGSVLSQNGQLSIEKAIVSEGQPLPPQAFPMTVTCGQATHTLSVASIGSSQSNAIVGNIPPGTVCTITEQPTPLPLGVCPANTTPAWEVYMSPGNNVTVQLGMTTIAVTNTLKCIPTQAQPDDDESPSSPSSLKCDSKTAKRVGQVCRCTISGMVPVSKTACGCSSGRKLKGGKCTSDAPKCKSNERFSAPRARCEPLCAKGTEYSVARNACVRSQPTCADGEVFQPKRQRCEIQCKAGTQYNSKRKACLPVAPQCKRGQVYNEKKRICVDADKRCKNGQVKFGKACVTPPRCRPGEIAHARHWPLHQSRQAATQGRRRRRSTNYWHPWAWH